MITIARSDPSLAEIARVHLDAVRDAATLPTPGGRLVAVQLAFAQASAGEPRRADRRDSRASPSATASAGGEPARARRLRRPDQHALDLRRAGRGGELVRARGGAGARTAASRSPTRRPPRLAAWTALLRGRLDDAELLARDALRIAGDVARPRAPSRPSPPSYLAATLRRTRRPGGGAGADRGDAGGRRPRPGRRPATALLPRAAQLAAGDAAAALEPLLACGRHQERAGILNPAFTPWRSAASAALRRLERGEEAVELAAAEVELARAFGAAGRSGSPCAPAAWSLGGEAGLADLEASVAALERSAAALELANSQVALGAALRRAGRRADARRPLAEGLRAAERLGAGRLAESARTELQASGARRRSGGSYDPDALTVAERRVCEMAAGGMSNREIAQALFVTRGTVESQLHAAYRKLGIAGRGELAAALARIDTSTV